MFLPLIRKARYAIPFLAGISLLIFSCQKEVSIDGATGPGPGPGPQYDLSTKISSSVSGFVTDENDVAVQNAVIQFGSYSTTTDKYGYFEAKNVQVTKNAAFVTAGKPGYFKGIKTYIASAGKSAFFRIKLIPRTNAGSINASAGGTVTMVSGLTVTLPAAGVVNAATNTAYTGTVNVAAFWINPESADLNKLMPGDLRGIDKDGAMKLLKTFGMAAVELTGSAGELLQIAAGKKATLGLTIPASLSTDANPSIPLWYFDETNGLWKEQGSAVKTGNKYVGEVSHFSYWNCAYPLPVAVQFDCTILDAAGKPVTNAEVGIYYSNGQFTGCMGATDVNGYTGGMAPGNSQLIVKVIDPVCSSQVLTSQSISTGNTGIALGNISVAITNIATITGSLTNCTNQPVTNGYVMLQKGTSFTRYPVSASGSFNFNTTFCGNMNVTIIGGDNATGQEGLIGSLALNSGINNVGNITACTNSNQEYVNFTVDGTAFSVIPGVPSWGVTLVHVPDPIYPNSIYIEATGVTNTLWFRFNDQNISAGSTQDLYHFWDGIIGMPLMPTIPIRVNIAEYGNIGQFISGNFSGTIYDFSPPNNPHTVTCNFRVRRQF
ncbi:MAG TPA: hypothetical protein VK484_01055 [Ferruginibacter sp.]|nr:hypothetical protein [Ferruginibacter sp.]